MIRTLKSLKIKDLSVFIQGKVAVTVRGDKTEELLLKIDALQERTEHHELMINSCKRFLTADFPLDENQKDLLTSGSY